MEKLKLAFTFIGIGIVVGAVTVLTLVLVFGAKLSRVNVGPIEFELPTSTPEVYPTHQPMTTATAVSVQLTATPTQEVESTSPTPEVVPLPLPFSDDFNSGLRSEWRVVSGQPVISQGRLTTIQGKTLALEIGGTGMHNYIAEYNFERGGQWASLISLPNPSLRISIEHWGGYGDAKAIWDTYSDGEWWSIQTTYIQLPDEGTLKMEVRPPQYFLYIDGEIVDSVVFESEGDTHSPLVIKLQHGLSGGRHFAIDNFVIRE